MFNKIVTVITGFENSTPLKETSINEHYPDVVSSAYFKIHINIIHPFSSRSSN
jgi:hypothetical protein